MINVTNVNTTSPVINVEDFIKNIDKIMPNETHGMFKTPVYISGSVLTIRKVLPDGAIAIKTGSSDLEIMKSIEQYSVYRNGREYIFIGTDAYTDPTKVYIID